MYYVIVHSVRGSLKDVVKIHFLTFELFGFSRQGFSVALEPVLELALVDQASFELTEICLPLPPECWD